MDEADHALRLRSFTDSTMAPSSCLTLAFVLMNSHSPTTCRLLVALGFLYAFQYWPYFLHCFHDLLHLLLKFCKTSWCLTILAASSLDTNTVTAPFLISASATLACASSNWARPSLSCNSLLWTSWQVIGLLSRLLLHAVNWDEGLDLPFPTPLMPSSVALTRSSCQLFGGYLIALERIKPWLVFPIRGPSTWWLHDLFLHHNSCWGYIALLLPLSLSQWWNYFKPPDTSCTPATLFRRPEAMPPILLYQAA